MISEVLQSRQTLERDMVSGDTFKPGDTVRDKKLGQIWTVVSNDGEGTLRIEGNGVVASASFWDLEPWPPSPPPSRQ